MGINTAEGVPLDTQPTAGNTGGVSGDPINQVVVSGGASVLCRASAAIHGSRGYEFVQSGFFSFAARMFWDVGSQSSRYLFSFYVKIFAAVTAIDEVASFRTAGDALMGTLTIAADGKLTVNNASGTAIAASKATNVFPVNTVVRVDFVCGKGTTTSNGTLAYAYYLGENATPVFTWEASNVNTGTTDIGQVLIGRVTTRTQTRTLIYDSLRWFPLASGFALPFTPPVTGQLQLSGSGSFAPVGTALPAIPKLPYNSGPKTWTTVGYNFAEGMDIGSVPTPANTGGNSGYACSSVEIAAGDHIVVTDFNPVDCSRGWCLDLSADGAGPTRMSWPFVSKDRVILTVNVGQITEPVTQVEEIMGISNATGPMGMLIVTADGYLQMLDATGLPITASKSGLQVPIDTRLNVDVYAKRGTTISNGTLGYRCLQWNSNDLPRTIHTWEAANVNAGTQDSASVWIGRSQGRLQANTIYYDFVRYGWGTASIFEDTPLTRPYAVLDGDKTVEPYSTVYITGMESYDLASKNRRDWWVNAFHLTQISGTHVELISTYNPWPSGMPSYMTPWDNDPVYTYVAPGLIEGDTLVFELWVEDTGDYFGPVSDETFVAGKSDRVRVTHTVLPVNEMMAVDHGWVPIQASLIQEPVPTTAGIISVYEQDGAEKSTYLQYENYVSGYLQGDFFVSTDPENTAGLWTCVGGRVFTPEMSWFTGNTIRIYAYLMHEAPTADGDSHATNMPVPASTPLREVTTTVADRWTEVRWSPFSFMNGDYVFIGYEVMDPIVPFLCDGYWGMPDMLKDPSVTGRQLFLAEGDRRSFWAWNDDDVWTREYYTDEWYGTDILVQLP